MTIRDFSSERPPEVEPFGNVNIKGCIVRWDYKPMMTMIPEAGARGAASRRLRSRGSAEETPQGKMVDSGMVSYSEMRYIGMPDPERVLADMRRDLEIRYKDSPHPAIDFDTYRAAIAALEGD